MIPFPDSGPSPFYFNGHLLPKWSAQWHLCSLGDFLNGYQDDWDEFIGHKHIWHLECRLDHQGKVESEDPVIFKICAQEVLSCLLTNKLAIVSKITESAPEGHSPLEIYDGILDGLERMLHLTHTDGCAFWTSGDDQDLAALKDCRARCQDSGACEPPHLAQRRSEQELRMQFQMRDLRRLAQCGTLDKLLRTLVNQLP